MRLRMIHMSAIPDTLYMVEDKPCHHPHHHLHPHLNAQQQQAASSTTVDSSGTILGKVQEMLMLPETVVKGTTIRYRGGGGGLVFAWPFLFISQGRWKALFFHLRIGCISTMPCGYLFISPVFSTKIFIKKKPSIIIVTSPLSIQRVAPKILFSPFCFLYNTIDSLHQRLGSHCGCIKTYQTNQLKPSYNLVK